MNSTSEAAATTTPFTPPAAEVVRPARTKFSAARPVIFGLLAIVAIAWSVRTALHAYHYEETDDAYVAGHLHEVSAQLDGQVKEVLVQENQTVRAGDVLLRLDPLEFQIALQKADAALAQARAMEAQTAAASSQADAALAEARARATQAEAQVAQADAQLGLAELTQSRNEQLSSHGGAITQADVDASRSGFRAAQAAGNAARANLVAARAAIGSAEASQAAAHAQIEAAHANTAAAEAMRRDAERKLAQATIVAPAAGRIGNKHVEPGNRVQAGQALLALAEPDTWVIANFKETQLAHMTPGQTVELTVDALPDQPLRGHLESVSPASGAQFALLPPDNSTGNFNKVVQRVPVRIILDDATRQQLGDRLRLGLSAVVDVRIR